MSARIVDGCLEVSKAGEWHQQFCMFSAIGLCTPPNIADCTPDVGCETTTSVNIQQPRCTLSCPHLMIEERSLSPSTYEVIILTCGGVKREYCI